MQYFHRLLCIVHLLHYCRLTYYRSMLWFDRHNFFPKFGRSEIKSQMIVVWIFMLCSNRCQYIYFDIFEAAWTVKSQVKRFFHHFIFLYPPSIKHHLIYRFVISAKRQLKFDWVIKVKRWSNNRWQNQNKCESQKENKKKCLPDCVYHKRRKIYRQKRFRWCLGTQW